MEEDEVKRLDYLRPLTCRKCGQTYSHICLACNYHRPKWLGAFDKMDAFEDEKSVDIPDALDYMSTENFEHRLHDGFEMLRDDDYEKQ
jgi:hypothetical protein